MNTALSGQTLAWGIWDSNGVVATALHAMLEQLLDARSVRQRMWLSESPQQMESLCRAYRLGIAVWVLRGAGHLAESCAALMAVREQHPATLCVCVLEAPRGDWIALLSEAGAQLIVGDLPTLQSALPRLVKRAPLSTGGTHPLTAGLMERLPWGDM